MATIKLEENELGNVLSLPVAEQDEICQQQHLSDREKRERLIQGFLDHSEYANWSELSGRLYYRNHHQATLKSKEFITKARGKLFVY